MPLRTAVRIAGCVAALLAFGTNTVASGDDGDRLHRSALYIIKRGDKFGFMDRSGSVVISPQFDDVEDFFEGVARVEVDGVYAFIDENGKVLLRLPEYTMVWSFGDGLAMVEVKHDNEIDGHRGFIDHSGKLVIPLRFRSSLGFVDGVAAAKDDHGRWGYISKQGKWVIPPKYKSADNFQNGLAVVRNYGDGMIDTAGNVVIPPEFVLGGIFKNGVVCALRPGGSTQFGLMDRNLKFIVAPRFDDCNVVDANLAIVRIDDKLRVDDKWGYIDASGEFVIQPRFHGARGFSEGLAAVEVGEKWGFIDPKGEFVIQPQYDDATEFKMGLAAVAVGDRWIYIDHSGAFVQVLRFEAKDQS
jgi:WG containing repeat